MVDGLDERVRRFTDPKSRIPQLVRDADELYRQAIDYATPLFREVEMGVPEGRRAIENYFFNALLQGVKGIFLIGKAIYRQNEVRSKKYEEILGVLRGQGTRIEGIMEYIKARQDDGK